MKVKMKENFEKANFIDDIIMPNLIFQYWFIVKKGADHRTG